MFKLGRVFLVELYVFLMYSGWVFIPSQAGILGVPLIQWVFFYDFQSVLGCTKLLNFKGI